MLKQSIIENVLEAALVTGGDFSEIFIEDKYTNEFLLQSGKIEQSIAGRDFGIGIRIFQDFKVFIPIPMTFQRKVYLQQPKEQH